MPKYYVNVIPQKNGDHEVHQLGCSSMPNTRIDLGVFSRSLDAEKAAKLHFPKARLCRFCAHARRPD